MEKTEFIHMRVYPKLKKDAEAEAKKSMMSLTTWVVQAILEKIQRDREARQGRS